MGTDADLRDIDLTTENSSAISVRYKQVAYSSRKGHDSWKHKGRVLPNNKQKLMSWDRGTIKENLVLDRISLKI